MVSARFRRAAATLGTLTLTGVGGAACAADTLPPLRVDPTLLGGAPLKPLPPKPAQPAPAPTTPAQPTSQTAAPVETAPAKTATTTPAAPAVPVAETAPAAEVPRSAAEVRQVAPPPVARDMTPQAAPAAPAAVPSAAPAPAAAAPSPATASAARPAPAPAVTAAAAPLRPLPTPLVPAARPGAPTLPTARVAGGPTLQNLPPLRVDPALLGGTALAQRPPVSTETQPPLIAAQPELAPLFSAHVAAGLIPHPSSTPLSATNKSEAPTIISARRISGVNDVDTLAEGDAFMYRAGDTLSAERILYRVAEDEVEAVGNVQLSSPDTSIAGPRMRMRMEESTGEFESPAYSIRRTLPPIEEPALTISGLPALKADGSVMALSGRKVERPSAIGSGVAERLEFRGEDLYHLEKASYSTCGPGRRDWEVVVDKMDLDYNTAVGTGTDAVVRFMGTPIFYTPWMTFSLNGERKSGMLPPTMGSTSKSGFEVTAPWYWNIAPNMDATITPRYMTKRGLQVNTEFRYLDYGYGGQARVEYLPDDKLTNRDRYGYTLLHNQNFGHGLTGVLRLNGVSDDDYFSDLSTRVSSVSQGNLLRQAKLNYGGSWYGATMNVQTYQTLQDLVSPYRRLPQVTAFANRHDLPLGLAFDFNAEYVNLDHPTKVLGKRTTLYPQISLPYYTPAFWLTPKLGLHSTQYDLDGQNRPDAVAWKNVSSQQSRLVPILSVDGGFVMERDSSMFGSALTQTLEPRAHYLYVPRRDQNDIPVFDTAIADFSYAQMFSENRYVGGDRVGDASQLTLALTSRMLDTTTGAELLRATLGSRYYFTQQDVTLPGEKPRSGRSADLLAALSGQVLPKVYADLAWQYNPRDDQTERLTVAGRYRPEAGKVFNAGYRFTRDLLGQIDVSAQWPIFGGWHGVGRYNYSTREHRVIETIAGLEYNADCWVGRLIVQRLATLDEKPTSAIFFQLELNDFSKIGSNPMDLLRRNIPGYGVINQPTSDPVFGTY